MKTKTLTMDFFSPHKISCYDACLCHKEQEFWPKQKKRDRQMDNVITRKCPHLEPKMKVQKNKAFISKAL